MHTLRKTREHHHRSAPDPSELSYERCPSCGRECYIAYSHCSHCGRRLHWSLKGAGVWVLAVLASALVALAVVELAMVPSGWLSPPVGAHASGTNR